MHLLGSKHILKILKTRAQLDFAPQTMRLNRNH